LINNGIVPTSDSFTYEGAFSEHDFFVESNSQCDDVICIETVLSKYKPIISNTEKDRYISQLIMTSNIDSANFKHKPIDLFIVLDKSGSMSGDRFDRSKEAIKSIIKKLNADDSLGLITFDDSYVVERELSLVGSDVNSILNKVDDFRIGNSTDIESALSAAYQILDRDGKKTNKRIILITDAKPNVNATGEGEFLDLIRNYEKTIGLTVFGVGIDFGIELTKSISETEGGNYIYLPNVSEIDAKLNDDFEFLISPIANNFNLKIKSSENFKIVNSYGLPANNDSETTLSAKTLFLSKSKGAIAIEFEYDSPNSGVIIPMNDEKVFSFDWSYDNLDDVKFEKSENTYFSPFTTTSGNYEYTIRGSQKLPFLVNMITTLKEVCDLYSISKDQDGVELLDKLLADLDSVNMILDDSQITEERYMIEKLKAILGHEVY
jgi:Ca-activated chloride channel family protein